MNRRILLHAPDKFKVLKKSVLAKCGSRFVPVYLVNEYPKSGGSWLKFMLADALELTAWTKTNPVFGSCVMQAHWLKEKGRCRTVAHFRDGRDVMVSYYYHSFFRNEFQNQDYVRYMREKFQFENYDDIKCNLLPFMKVVLDSPISPSFSWIEFSEYWLGREGVVYSNYELLLSSTADELTRIVYELTGNELLNSQALQIVEKYNLKNMRQEKIKQNSGAVSRLPAEKSFIRKGKSGSWSGSFSDEALEWFEGKAGNTLNKLGYKLGRPTNVSV